MKTLSIVMVANAPQQLMVPGRYCHLIAAAFPVTVEIQEHAGASSGLTATLIEAGTWFRQPFQALRITSTVAQTIKIAISDFDVGVFRVAGEVSIVDGAVKRALGGKSFFAWLNKAAVAAQYSYGQLWNPATSGVNLAVTQFGFMLGVAGVFSLDWYNAALGAVGFAPQSKNLLGAASVTTESRNGAEAVPSGSFLTSFYGYALGTPNTPFRFTDPVLVPPGSGLIWRHNTLNASINIFAEFYEEALP